MDLTLVLVAFVAGLSVRLVGLPPLVGFLTAGFALNALGFKGGDVLAEISDLGVQLLLFTIGLKLDLRSLTRSEVWGTASLHVLITLLIFAAGIYALSLRGIGVFATLGVAQALLLAFALSFSSTVFAVKALEERGDTTSLHGRIAIGILIMQDLFAVLFLTLSLGKLPSLYALLLFGLPILRPVIITIMDRSGHGELLVLLGLLLSLGGAQLFEAVGVKPDLGPLIIGIIIGSHPKADELAKRLLGFKDLFLTAFFLEIGLAGPPTLQALGWAVLLTLLVPLKVALFFFLMARFGLRVRTAFLGSLSLANYSEFGLIVAAVGAANGWLGSDWLVIIAIALSITFVLASPLNISAHAVYARFDQRLARFERPDLVPDERRVDVGDAEVLVFGMGRIGSGAYDALREQFGNRVVGLDCSSTQVERQKREGRRVFLGDAADSDFWERLDPQRVRLVLLAMHDHKSNLYAARRLCQSEYRGLVASVAQFPDEAKALEGVGVHAAFNLYREAGSGFAKEVCDKLGGQLG